MRTVKVIAALSVIGLLAACHNDADLMSLDGVSYAQYEMPARYPDLDKAMGECSYHQKPDSQFAVCEKIRKAWRAALDAIAAGHQAEVDTQNARADAAYRAQSQAIITKAASELP